MNKADTIINDIEEPRKVLFWLDSSLDEDN